MWCKPKGQSCQTLCKTESRVFLIVACRMGTIALTSPVGPGEGLRVVSGGGCWMRWALAGHYRSQHCSPGKAGCSFVSAHIRGKPHPALQDSSLPQLALSLLLDQGFVLRSTEKMKCDFKCHVLMMLRHFNGDEALCACDSLADILQGGNNLDFLC